MKQKDLTSYSTVPQLLYHFQNAHKKLLDVKIVLPPSQYRRFQTFESKLRSEGIDPRAYAYGVLPLLEWLRKKNNSQTIPTNMFLGTWALKQYKEKCDTTFETIDEADISKGELLQAERMAVEYFVACKQQDSFIRFDDAVQDLRTMLPGEWWDMYDHGGRLELEVAMLDELSLEHGYITNYDEI